MFIAKCAFAFSILWLLPRCYENTPPTRRLLEASGHSSTVCSGCLVSTSLTKEPHKFISIPHRFGGVNTLITGAKSSIFIDGTATHTKQLSTWVVARKEAEALKGSNMTNTPLEQVPSWSEDQVARMKESWITTAEQIVAVSATQDGVRSLAEHLAISEDKMRRLVDSARATLDPSERAVLEQRNDTRESGLGALSPQ